MVDAGLSEWGLVGCVVGFHRVSLDHGIVEHDRDRLSVDSRASGRGVVDVRALQHLSIPVDDEMGCFPTRLERAS